MSETETETERLSLIEAVRDAIATEMARDDEIVVFGEDAGELGGVFRATEGLQAEFGEDRVMDTPLSESAIVGAAVGLAAAGMKPIVEFEFAGFAHPAFGQLTTQAARLRARTNGYYNCQLVLRMPYGTGPATPSAHAESMEAVFAHYPGLHVVVPSTPSDTKGLLSRAIRTPDPVVFMEPHQLYRRTREAVPTGEHTVSFGEADVRREGEDVSVFTWGSMIPPTIDAARDLDGDVDVEVVDLRTVSPLDMETVEASIRKTGRGVVVHEEFGTLGMGAEVASRIQEHSIGYQRAPVTRVTGYDVPVPHYSMQQYYAPTVGRIKDGIERAARYHV